MFSFPCNGVSPRRQSCCNSTAFPLGWAQLLNRKGVMSQLLLLCVKVFLCNTLKSRKLIVLRIFDFPRNLCEQRNECGFLAILVHAVEMLENKHRPHKCTWRKAFIGLYIITDTVNVNAAVTYLQTYNNVFPQTEQLIYPNISTSYFSTKNLKGIDLWYLEMKSSTSNI